MSHWNLRVMRLKHHWADEPYFTVCEVYYDAAGVPNGYTHGQNSDALESDSLEDLRVLLQRMLNALDKPVLTHEDTKGKS